MDESIKIGHIVRDEQGRKYQIIATAEHELDHSQLLIYQELFGECRIMARPLMPQFQSAQPAAASQQSAAVAGSPAAQGSGLAQDSVTAESGPSRFGAGASAGTPAAQGSGLAQGSVTAESGPSRFGAGASAGTPAAQGSGAVQSSSAGRAAAAEPKQKSITDLMIDFLDERDFDKKQRILDEMALRQDITDSLIDNLAAALDIVIDEGPIDQRMMELRQCVRTRAHFELRRFR